MILVSHPRAGTEYFFDCSYEVKFGRRELFGRKSDTTKQHGLVPPLSLAAKSAMIKHADANRGHKVMLYALLDETSGSDLGARLIEHLKQRDDVYLLRRRNVRAAFLSLLIASRNNQNYHGPSAELQQPFSIEHDEVILWNHRMNLVFNEDPLSYREVFWYEDIISGEVQPKTFAFDSKRSTRERRVSTRLKHLITNLSDVERWMDEVEMPGSVTA